MKGVVKFARGDGFVELRDCEDSEPGPGQVRIKVEATGICGSDLHIYHDTINYNIRTPVVIGHEFSGVVVDKGVGADEAIEIGDRVTGEPSIEICGRCDYCLSEHYNMCSERKVMGYYHDGSFAPYCNATFVHKLPDNVDFEAGALTELLACCVHSVIEQAGVTAGDLVAITGPGPVGLFSAFVAKAEGGRVVLLGTGRDKARLALAAELGIDHVVNIDEEDPVAAVQGLSGGYGADVVVECAGVAPAINLALELVRKRGKLSQMGLPGAKVNIDFEKVAYKELQVSGGIGQRRPAWKRSLKLLEMGAIPCDRLVSHRLPLKDWQRAFEMAENQEGVKLLLMPQG
jgi:L-iditol 2-dehydrogenase